MHWCRSVIWPLKANTIAKFIARVESSIISTALRPNISTFRPVPTLEIPSLCAPICNAVVEVYEKTCCCRPRPPFDVDYLLGAHQKCLFSIDLRMEPKHTNGFGIITAYRAPERAAIALEKVPCLDLAMAVPRVAERVELLK